VRTERDGAWRTLDGQALYRERGAAAAINTLVMENQLAAKLGVEFVNQADGHRREIKGVSQRLMDEFSSRARNDICPALCRSFGLCGRTDAAARSGEALTLAAMK
jgi:hypothetical protein